MTAVAPSQTSVGAQFGTYSEVGTLRKVMVHKPDLELKRLTPLNHDELLFDDVLWVKRATEQHEAFEELLRSRGIEVFLEEELLAQALEDREGRKWVLDRAVTSDTVGPGMSDEIRAYLDEVDAVTLADHLIGGLTAREALNLVHNRHPEVGTGIIARGSLVVSAMEGEDFILRPLPNSYFTRDPSAWLYNGVVVNPMYWPARRLEALNLEAIYRFAPMFKNADFEFWYSRDQEGEDFGTVSSEGGDIMPIGNRTVAIGMSERTTGQMIEKIALSMFAKGAADRVIAAVMTKDRAHMHLDTVFTLIDRDAATAYHKVVDNIGAFSLDPPTRRASSR